jgi:hypothetical protein
MAEEIAVFARSAVYFGAIGAVYWFLTYEVAGSMLLVGSALASAFVAIVLRLGLRGQDTVAAAPGASEVRPDGPFGDESGALPAPTAAPLGVAFGLALVVLGLVFTGALVLAGAILVLLASREWLRAAMAESTGAGRDRPAPGSIRLSGHLHEEGPS